MKKLLLVCITLFSFSAHANEAKEKIVAKYVMENIQKDYVNCYSFYKVAAESFKKAGKEKNIIDSLESSADVSLKYNYDLGEIMGLDPKVMAQMTKDKVNSCRVSLPRSRSINIIKINPKKQPKIILPPISANAWYIIVPKFNPFSAIKIVLEIL